MNSNMVKSEKFGHLHSTFKCQPHKIVKHTQSVFRQQQIVGLAHKGLIIFVKKL